MIADLNSSADNKAFVVHSADATDQLTQAVAIVGSRHNNGANFAFVDGHTTWISKEKITPSLFAPSVPATSVVWPIDMGEIYKNDKVGTGFYTDSIGNLAPTFAAYGFTRIAGTTGSANGSTQIISGTASSLQSSSSGLPTWLDTTLSLPASQLYLQGKNNGLIYWGGTASTQQVFGLKGDVVSTPSTFTFTLVPTVDGAKKIAIVGAMQELQNGSPYFTIPTITYYTNATKTAVEKTVTMSTDCKEKYDGWIAGQGAAGDVRKCQARARMIYLKLKANKAIDITVYINHNGSTVAQQQAIWMLFEE
ncbi:MAG TPA: H-X9-DG-CTERM domain-containing protein [Armatimonadota bacterium]